ncbi:Zinc/iron permease [Ascodesmis nigricans]|uniref:Zinc/iron permease n=1 Tax=Ascodesmis nigricans TaxID=341454 RepID=A0A4S2MYX9_9PEZI|nr:Zinc/iron permease [Ascodesmis nigricans]
MNCPTRDTNPEGYLGYNQSPPQFAPELTTRSSLVCGGKAKGEYNLPLHVLALFIVLIQSILSCSFPLIVKRFPQLRVPHQFLFLSKHFGTGVLIATAFVHLLPTAFSSLTDPCLPSFWNEGYPAMAGLIAMIAVFFVVVIEMIFSSMNGGVHVGCHSGDFDTVTGNSNPSSRHRRNTSASMHSLLGRTNVGTGVLVRPSMHRRSRSGSMAAQLSRLEFDVNAAPEERERFIRESTDDSRCAIIGDPDIDEDTTLSGSEDDDADEGTAMKPISTGQRRESVSSRWRNGRLTEAQQQQKNLLQVMLLEAGILFHSVFIGMALSVATGSNFIVLLIAIVFHQTFEGLALGSRIAALKAFSPSSPKPWLMCLAYGTTTPIGQAIGLMTRNLYDPESQTGLLMVGTMNAISSGLLLFAGLVELLAEDFLSDESYVVLTGRRRLWASLAVGGGAVGMAVVGAWA